MISMVLINFVPEFVGCGWAATPLDVVYTSPYMTIQFCIEVCRGAGLPIAAVTVKGARPFDQPDVLSTARTLWPSSQVVAGASLYSLS